MSEETQPELLRKLAEKIDEKNQREQGLQQYLKGLNELVAEINMLWSQLDIPSPLKASAAPKEKVSKTVKLRKETSNSDKHKGLDQLKEEAAGQAPCPKEQGG